MGKPGFPFYPDWTDRPDPDDPRSPNFVDERAESDRHVNRLIILYIGFGIPFGVLVMRGFFRTIPTAIIEAARIDGCSYFRIFFRIALPLAMPAVITLCILDGVATWNEFILAQIFLRSDELRTLPLGLVQFSTQFSTQYDQLAAAVLISVVPVIFVFLFFQRYFVSGMAGAVK